MVPRSNAHKATSMTVQKIGPEHKKKLIRLMEAGMINPANVARYLGISPQAVGRWIDADAVKKARRELAERVIRAVLEDMSD